MWTASAVIFFCSAFSLAWAKTKSTAVELMQFSWNAAWHFSIVLLPFSGANGKSACKCVSRAMQPSCTRPLEASAFTIGSWLAAWLLRSAAVALWQQWALCTFLLSIAAAQLLVSPFHMTFSLHFPDALWFWNVATAVCILMCVCVFWIDRYITVAVFNLNQLIHIQIIYYFYFKNIIKYIYLGECKITK